MKTQLLLLFLAVTGQCASPDQPPPVFVAPTPATPAPVPAQNTSNPPPVKRATTPATPPSAPAPPPSAAAKLSSSDLEKLAMPIALHPEGGGAGAEGGV